MQDGRIDKLFALFLYKTYIAEIYKRVYNKANNGRSDEMGDKYTEAQKKASIKYMQDKTDDIRLRVPKGTKERWKAAAEKAGVSMTKYVLDTIEAAIEAQDH